MKHLRQYIRNLLLEHSLPSNLEIASSSINGVGVFALENIPMGTNLGAAQIKTSSGYDVTELGRKHNHSYKPNCVNRLKNGIRYLYTKEDLQSGDELTIDYTQQPDLEQPKHDWK